LVCTPAFVLQDHDDVVLPGAGMTSAQLAAMSGNAKMPEGRAAGGNAGGSTAIGGSMVGSSQMYGSTMMGSTMMGSSMGGELCPPPN
jgi:hypothetical protein